MPNRIRMLASAFALIAALMAGTALAANLPRSLILEQGKLAKYPTPAEGPGKWGVSAADFSVLSDQELARKAGLPGKREAIQVGAQLGDAYAQYLMGGWILAGGTAFSKEDGWRFMRGAQQQGVVRAVTQFYGAIAMAGGLDAQGATAKLAEMAATGNAFSIYAYGAVLYQRASVPSTRDDALLQIRKAAELGYAPAKDTLAKLAAAPAPAPATVTAPPASPTKPVGGKRFTTTSCIRIPMDSIKQDLRVLGRIQSSGKGEGFVPTAAHSIHVNLLLLQKCTLPTMDGTRAFNAITARLRAGALALKQAPADLSVVRDMRDAFLTYEARFYDEFRQDGSNPSQL